MPSSQAQGWLAGEWERLVDPAGQRLELLHGEVVMTPAPTPRHQYVGGRLMEVLNAACSPGWTAVTDVE